MTVKQKNEFGTQTQYSENSGIVLAMHAIALNLRTAKEYKR